MIFETSQKSSLKVDENANVVFKIQLNELRVFHVWTNNTNFRL